MKLIVMPDDGIDSVLTSIKRAKHSLDVLIFRLDRKEVVDALTTAVARGVNVRALTAYTNKGGEKQLRELELALLAGGVTVSRTEDDLVRYHGKMMIVDGRLLHVFGFNFTKIDFHKSRSFAVATRNPRLVREALKLFEADFNRQPYTAGSDRLIVSPENALKQLSAFIRGAQRELLIYDLQVSHPAIRSLLAERQKAGVDIRIIGKLSGNKSGLSVEKYPGKKLHVRAMIRDGRAAFLGSQSLRKLELEKRREIGIIIHDSSVVQKMHGVFEKDWAETDSGKAKPEDGESAGAPASA